MVATAEWLSYIEFTCLAALAWLALFVNQNRLAIENYAKTDTCLHSVYIKNQETVYIDAP